MINRQCEVVVASTNPVKIDAVRNGFASMFGEIGFNIVGQQAKSNISDQPMTENETFDGAKNRVDYISTKYPTAHFWVGIEGGIDEHDVGMYTFAWIAIKSRRGNMGIARTASFFLPLPIVEHIHNTCRE